MMVPARVRFLDAYRLRTESADAFRVTAPADTATTFRPADFSGALVQLYAHLSASLRTVLGCVLLGRYTPRNSGRWNRPLNRTTTLRISSTTTLCPSFPFSTANR